MEYLILVLFVKLRCSLTAQWIEVKSVNALVNLLETFFDILG